MGATEVCIRDRRWQTYGVLDPAELRTADDVDALAAALHSEPLPPMEGVLHVTAVAREGDGLTVMKIGEHSPKSPLDFFSLNLARARVDAILVTGSVLRAEPELRYELGGASRALHAWRDARYERPPYVLVLSRGGLDGAHPVWQSWARPIAFVPAEAEEDVRAALPARVEVVAGSGGARGAIEWLRADKGCRGVSVEAGPSVAVPLYEGVIDELQLSVFEGALDPRGRAGAMLSEAELAERLERVGGSAHGEWRFSRWRARRGTAEGSG